MELAMELSKPTQLGNTLGLVRETGLRVRSLQESKQHDTPGLEWLLQGQLGCNQPVGQILEATGKDIDLIISFLGTSWLALRSRTSRCGGDLTWKGAGFWKSKSPGLEVKETGPTSREAGTLPETDAGTVTAWEWFTPRTARHRGGSFPPKWIRGRNLSRAARNAASK